MGLPSKSVRGASSPPTRDATRNSSGGEKKCHFKCSQLRSARNPARLVAREKEEAKTVPHATNEDASLYLAKGKRKERKTEAAFRGLRVPDTFSHACRQRPAQSRWLPGISLARPELLLPAAARAPLSEGAAPPRSDQGTPDSASAPEGKEVTRPKQAHARQEKREPARREGGSSTAGGEKKQQSSASKAGEMPSRNPSGSLYLAPQKRNPSFNAPCSGCSTEEARRRQGASERAAPDAADSHIRLGLRRRLQPQRLPPADVNVTVTWLAANPKSIGRRSNHSPAL